MAEMIILGLNINPILFQQLQHIATNENKIYYTLKKASIIDNIRCVASLVHLRNRTVFIYNTSFQNMVVILYFKMFRKNKIVFHCHDPLPHSGWKNPIIFIINYIIVQISDEVNVFSTKLKQQMQKIYSAKNVNIVFHGFNGFIYEPTQIAKMESVTVGIFGRNMPYKGFANFEKLASSLNEVMFYCIGEGYPECDLENVVYYDGVVDNDFYYSLIADLDYVFFGHKTISYSGVLNDIKILKKRVICPQRLELELSRYGIELESITDLKLTKQIPTSQLSREGDWSNYWNYE